MGRFFGLPKTTGRGHLPLHRGRKHHQSPGGSYRRPTVEKVHANNAGTQESNKLMHRIIKRFGIQINTEKFCCHNGNKSSDFKRHEYLSRDNTVLILGAYFNQN